MVEVVLGSFCKVSFTCTYVLQNFNRDYSMSIRGFSQFRFQWSRPFLGSFARHIDKTHFWLFRDQPVSMRVFSHFRFRCPALRQVKVVSGVVSKSCWYARVWLVRGHAVLIRVFSQFRFDSIHCTFWMKTLRTLPTFLRKKKTKGNFPALAGIEDVGAKIVRHTTARLTSVRGVFPNRFGILFPLW